MNFFGQPRPSPKGLILENTLGDPGGGVEGMAWKHIKVSRKGS